MPPARDWRVQWTELGLILLALAFTGCGFVLLALVEKGEITAAYTRPWWMMVAFGIAGWGVLTWRAPGRDPLLFPIAVLLCGWGLIEVARLQESFLPRQLLWVAAGMVALLAAAALPYRWYWLSRYRYLWLLAGLGLLGLTIVWGVNPLGIGDRLWLSVGRLVYFQPSELLKLAVVIFLASYLAERRELLVMTRVRIGPLRLPPLPYLAPLGLMWGFSLLLLIWQQDLGAALLFFSTFLSMLYVATGRRMYVVIGLGMLVVVALAGYVLFDRVQLRGDIWLDPWADPRGDAYQIVQSLLAFASGGILGSGVGLGYPTPYIPVVHSDFVFAAIGEEWGMLGALGVLLALLVLVSRGLYAGLRAARRSARWPATRMASSFTALLAVGLSAMLGWQSLIILGGTLKVIPLTGITLPFVSYGGSSMLISCVMVGLLLRVSALPGPDRVYPARPRWWLAANRFLRTLSGGHDSQEGSGGQ
jgi:cell division protein FtsW (lipid II flippase)